MREAIAIATEAGQGREVAILHNNLADALWAFEGPGAALEVMRAGIAFARGARAHRDRRVLNGSTAETLVEMGELDEALALAAEIATAEFEQGALDLAAGGAAAQIFAFRGRAARWPKHSIGWKPQPASRVRSTWSHGAGLRRPRSCRPRTGRTSGRSPRRGRDHARQSRNPNYPAYLPAMVRTALTLGDSELAQRLGAGVEPQTPNPEHALVAASAALAESRATWGRGRRVRRCRPALAVVRGRSRAGVGLLGQGRSLTHLGRTSEASPFLQQAREIFQALPAAPALAETDKLLQQATAFGS